MAKFGKSISKKTTPEGDTLYTYKSELEADMAKQRLKNLGFDAEEKGNRVRLKRLSER